MTLFYPCHKKKKKKNNNSNCNNIDNNNDINNDKNNDNNNNNDRFVTIWSVVLDFGKVYAGGGGDKIVF